MHPCARFLQEAISKFVAELKEQGVFAKEVRSAGVAFHSYYMASIAPALLDALKKVPQLLHMLNHINTNNNNTYLKYGIICHFVCR